MYLQKRRSNKITRLHGIPVQAGMALMHPGLHHHSAVHFQVQYRLRQLHLVPVPAAAAHPAAVEAVEAAAAGRMVWYDLSILVNVVP